MQQKRDVWMYELHWPITAGFEIMMTHRYLFNIIIKHDSKETTRAGRIYDAHL